MSSIPRVADVTRALQPGSGVVGPAPGPLQRLACTLGLLHAGVDQFVTLFSVVTAVASQALPALPGASPAREGHHADL